jgi:nucleoside-diphosphate-sugar epimerase
MAPAASSLHAYRGAVTMVLGASGFIGRWVARALNDAGARIVLAVRDAGAIPWFLRDGAGVAIHRADLSLRGDVRHVITSTRPDIVFNLAGYGVDRSERDEAMARTINATLPQWIAEAMAGVAPATWRGQRLVHAGSALEYGEMGGDLAEDSRANPTTLYGRTKLDGTLALRDAGTAAGLRCLTARLFTVYGAGEHPGRLLPTLLEARATSGPIPLSAGLQRRDFAYVEDVAEGLLRLGMIASAESGEIVNLATGTLTEVRAFVAEAARTLGIDPERLRFGALPTRAEEMQHDPVSVRRMRALIDWTPPTSIAEGVRATAAQTDGASRSS